MADVFSKQKRSDIMRSVRSSGNKSTEIKLLKQFKLNSIKGWRRHFDLIGKPDFVFPKAHLSIFADGCFWHGHTCRNVKPSSNRSFWKNKVDRNSSRDRRVAAILRRKGWHVVRIWECEIDKGTEKKIAIIKHFLDLN